MGRPLSLDESSVKEKMRRKGPFGGESRYKMEKRYVDPK